MSVTDDKLRAIIIIVGIDVKICGLPFFTLLKTTLKNILAEKTNLINSAPLLKPVKI